MPKEYIQKLEDRIHKTDTCWIWKGENSGQKSSGKYGRFKMFNKTYQAHRVSYEYFTQTKIPDGLVLDHLCRNTLCVNPEHLEAVTRKENTLRGEGRTAKAFRRNVCLYGHPLTGSNLKIDSGRGEQWRTCRTCKNKNQQEYMLRKYGRPMGKTRVEHINHPSIITNQ